jgi:hypothetical protein
MQVYVAEVKMAGLNVHTIIRRYSEFMDLHEKVLSPSYAL